MPQDDVFLFNFRLSVEEVVENVVNYAYENGDGFLDVEVDKLPGSNRLFVVLCDGGHPFNPLAKEDPDLTLAVEDRPIGGLGIFLCKQLMDEVTYRYENGCNILTLQKEMPL